MRIQKKGGQNLPVDVCVFGRFVKLSPAAVHSANCRIDTGVKWWIPVSSIVIYLREKILRWNSCKQPSEWWRVVVFDRMWAKVNICQWAGSIQYCLLIDKCSWKMVNTLPSDIFNSFAISRNFNLWSAKTSLWSFCFFSGTTAEFGWPEPSASFVSVGPRLKSEYHLLIVFSNGVES